MKKVLFLLTILTLVFSSCQNDEFVNEKEYLTKEMNNQLALMSQELGNIIETKNSIDLDNYITEEYDYSLLPLWIIDYIEEYTASDDFTKWDEKDIISSICMDKSLNDEQKLIIAKTLAYGIFVTENMTHDYIVTKASLKECDQVYMKDLKRIAVGFIWKGAIGLLGGYFGVAAVVIETYVELEFAEEDYNDCLQKI